MKKGYNNKNKYKKGYNNKNKQRMKKKDTTTKKGYDNKKNTMTR